jgi:hypothetical protein
MKTISSVGLSQLSSRHFGYRGQTVFSVGIGNQNSWRELVGKRSCSSRSMPNDDNQQKYSEVRVVILLPNQPMELSHWSAMFDNSSPVLIKGMRIQRLFYLYCHRRFK